MRPQAAAGVTRPVRLDSTLSEVQRPDGTAGQLSAHTKVLLSAAQRVQSPGRRGGLCASLVTAWGLEDASQRLHHAEPV